MSRMAAASTIAILIGLAACQGPGTSEQTTSPIPSLSSPPVASLPAGSPTQAPVETPPQPLAVDSIVQARVPDLRVRAAPGLDGRALGTLPLEAQSFVVEGPVEADGHEWYRLHGLGLSEGTGCEGPPQTDPFNCPGWFGWVAAYGPDGSEWLVPDVAACPAWSDGPLEEAPVLGLGFLANLACYGGETHVVVGHYFEVPDGIGGNCPDVPAELLWLACSSVDVLGQSARDDFSIGLAFAVAPGVRMPRRGQTIEVKGHYDDPAASGCTFGTDPARSVLFCRATFVVTAARTLDG